MSDDHNPHELDDRLRAALAHEADQLQPEDRLSQIRAGVDAARGGRVSRWVAPAAAAAAVAVVAVGGWAVTRGSSAPPVPSGTVTQSATTSPDPWTPGSGDAPKLLPVYRVLPVTGTDGTSSWRLVRELVDTPAGTAGDRASLAQAAVSLALKDPAVNASGFVNPWPEGETVSVSLADPEIRIVLGKGGRTGYTEDQQRIAVQQLVWTATASAGPPTSPVVVTTSGPLFENVTGNVFKRPSDDRVYEELAPISVEIPIVGQVLPKSGSVHASGEACTFEGTVSWTLSRDGTQVAKGSTQATAGCPSLGTWTQDFGTLPAGAYELRTFEASAADGTARGTIVVPFTVR